ncbi:Bug family tripartite tricarboxylate transporter substrate binding protein [Plastoroseomonas hellenica]|uniref:Bug family tripartite tricarboxylate transporter substrate binding protein n=1 Tax=Plastoroseomonas hellenica TaxID=2687306 RepID=UPI001BA52778|nr:tripartite tricarboxylate transporter substrate-binding protein [Plastoroseomonas hellenica]MBR0641898.1 tripartite tricarboxylate transporter substrate binding protein [Plastoroseomonas hellenica]
MPLPALRPQQAALGHLRRRRIVGASLVAMTSRVAVAQAPWPDRPVRMLVGFPAGGVGDLIARAIAPALSATFGRPFVVENRPGAGGAIAAQAVAQSTDGHTLGAVLGGPTTTARALNPALAYDPTRDFTAISQIFRTGFVIAVHPALPVTDLGGFIAHARANPGRLSYGSIGPGTVTHLAMEELKARHGLDIEHVTYRGFGQMTLDLAAGRIQVCFDTFAESLAFAQDGRIRALAVTTEVRNQLLPDVPTVAEAGEPGAECFGWTGVVAPAGFPAERARAIADAIRQAIAVPEGRANLDTQGIEFVGSTPEEFAALQAREAARWIAVIQRLGLRAAG